MMIFQFFRIEEANNIRVEPETLLGVRLVEFEVN